MHTQFNSVSRIDRGSRVLFPAVFLAVNMVYWYAYLSHSERMQREDEVGEEWRGSGTALSNGILLREK